MEQQPNIFIVRPKLRPPPSEAVDTESTKPDRLLRLTEVQQRVPLSRSQIWRKVRDGTLPKPKRIGKRAIAWRESDIDRWLMNPR
jgi:prophage regulatory protein